LKKPEPIIIIFGNIILIILASKNIYNLIFASNIALTLLWSFQNSGNDVVSHVTAVCKHAIRHERTVFW